MGNTHWGLGNCWVFICICLVMMAHKCMGGGNLTTASCHEQERLALLKFKRSVTDPNGMLSSWGVGNECCRWERVRCDDATGRIVGLHLESRHKGYYRYDSVDYYLEGDEVNSCLTELVNLKHLDLSGNEFYPSLIPKFIGTFKQLRYLNLSKSGFIGNIPIQIGNLSNLKVLDLNSQPRYLISLDMAWIFGLSKLEHLDLSGMDLSMKKILDSLLYTPSLLNLILSNCELSMANLGSRHLNSSRQLTSIKHLDLSNNIFTGQLPSLFQNMTSLAFLDLSMNDLSMPWRFEYLLNIIPSVSFLRLSQCNIQNINLSPTTLSFSNIQHLDLSDNKLEGKFPSVLRNMSSLLSLDLSGNKFNSSIPVMPNLLKLDISGNNLRHIEDVGIWRQCHLKELIVSWNSLEGELIGPSTNVSKCPQHALEVLYLDWNALKCLLPEFLEALNNLRHLDLSSNLLSGTISESLGRLTNLRHLDLSSKFLYGTIPKSIVQLSNLYLLDISDNALQGFFSESLGRLTNLRHLDLSSNLLNGTIPKSIGQLNNLYLLDISNNSLQGVVSEDHFSNLSMLKYLYADSNNKFLFNISREWIPPFQLNVVRLGSCKINDEFPQWIRTQRKLEKLVLSNANISGTLPTWFRLLPVIKVLDLSYNKLTGPLTNLPYVYEARYKLRGIQTSVTSVLRLRNNLFDGLIPVQLCTRKDLQVLDLSRNSLTGKIPKCLWNLPSNVMLLSSNRLSGVIPSPPTLGYSPLNWLQLNDNNLTGELPRDLGYFKHLVVLDLGENKISGDIPEWIGNIMTGLVAFRLHKNNFTGHIPQSLCRAQENRILDLSHNNLIGSIPRCFGNFSRMMKTHSINNWWEGIGDGSMSQVLKGVALDYTKNLEFLINMDLSSNRLDGEIPETLTALEALMGLNLSYNHISGGIPKNIGNMKALNSLDLSANELSGIISPSLAALNFLSHLNLSHNNLSGKIPTGNQLQTLTDPSMYDNNTYLCGAPLPKECSPHEKPPTTTSENKVQNANDINKVWFYLDITSGFAAGFWGIIGILCFKKKWRQKLFMISESAMDKIYVAVAVTVLKMKRAHRF